MFYPPQRQVYNDVLSSGLTFAKCAPVRVTCVGVVACVCWSDLILHLRVESDAHHREAGRPPPNTAALFTQPPHIPAHTPPRPRSQPSHRPPILTAHQTNRRGSYWSSTRAALQPLFHSTGLASYHKITAGAVTELEADLAAAAKEGVPVDVAAAMCNLALKVVGEAAFGVKFDVFEKDARGRIVEDPIVGAAKYVLENTAAGERAVGVAAGGFFRFFVQGGSG